MAALARPLVPGAVLLAVLLAGCGGGAEGPREAASQRCAQAASALEEVAWPPEDQLTLQTAAAPLEEIRDVHVDLRDDLDTLAEQDADLAEVVLSAGPLIESLDALAAASADGDQARFDENLAEVLGVAEDTAAAAQDVGVPGCYDTTGF